MCGAARREERGERREERGERRAQSASPGLHNRPEERVARGEGAHLQQQLAFRLHVAQQPRPRAPLLPHRALPACRRAPPDAGRGLGRALPSAGPFSGRERTPQPPLKRARESYAAPGCVPSCGSRMGTLGGGGGRGAPTPARARRATWARSLWARDLWAWGSGRAPRVSRGPLVPASPPPLAARGQPRLPAPAQTQSLPLGASWPSSLRPAGPTHGDASAPPGRLTHELHAQASCLGNKSK
jgi:hypothetical protein